MDKIDKHIISVMNKNGRSSFRDISKNLKISHSAVKKRFDKLNKKKIIKISGLTDYEQIGLTKYILFLSVVKKEEIKKSVITCVKSLGYFETYGEFNLAIIFLVEDPSTLDCIIEKCIDLQENNIKKRLIMPVLNPSEKFISLNFDNKNKSESHKKKCKTCDAYNLKKCAGCQQYF